MSEKNIKKTYKWFWDFDYDKQEKYYTKMHAKGWALKKQEREGTAFEQRFEKCEPANVVYKVGYNAVKTGRGSFIKMFEDYGWEYCGEMNDFYCFRKSADGASAEELDIFSDDESRLNMSKKAVTAWLPMLTMCTFCILIPQTVSILGDTERGRADLTALILHWAVYVWGYIGVFVSSRRHKKQIKKSWDQK